MKSKKTKSLAPMNEFRKEIKKFILNLKNELKEKPQKHIYDVNYYGSNKVKTLSVYFYNKKINKKSKEHDLLCMIDITHDGQRIKIEKMKIRYVPLGKGLGNVNDEIFDDLDIFYPNEIKEALEEYKYYVYFYSKSNLKDYYYKKMPHNFEP
tara:strand:- start:39 stop:494 length:456 start_codon:yes stop_codon:yes gene_type:complete